MSEAAIPLALGTGASALGTYLGAQASASAARDAAQLQQQRFSQASANQQPFIQGGQNALNRYSDALGLNGPQAQQAYYDAFRANPGFQASVDYGLAQIQAANAARGMTLSGNTLAALQDYSQKALSGEYHTTLDDLFRASQLGAASANALTTAATASANNQGNYTALAGQYDGTALSKLGSSLYSAGKDLSSYYNGNKTGG
jgi:hypothetical protein